MANRLLIADDSTTIQKVFERTFPEEEFVITFASNGEEAASKAREIQPDLIIADVNMPGKTGFQVCEEVKGDPALKDTPVLLLIGILDDFDEDESRRVGADGFIVKPFEANAAIQKVRDVLTAGGRYQPVEEGEVQREAMAEEEEEILELVDAVEEPAVATAAPPVEEAKEELVLETPAPPEAPPEELVLETPAPSEEPKEEFIFETPAPSEEPKKEFVLETPLKDLEVELQERYPEAEKKEEEALTLDLSLDEVEERRAAEEAESTSLFGELEVGEPEVGFKEEQVESVLTESAGELEKIAALTPEPEEVVAEKTEAAAEAFEPVFEPGEVVEKIVVPEEELAQALKPTLEGMADQLATALAGELRKAVERVIEEKVPAMIREEMERATKG